VATLDRWSAIADHVHVVTLPQAGAPADTLWLRFAAALELDPDGFDLDVARSNASLSARDAELLRRLNKRLPEDLRWPEYDRLVKRRFNRAANRGGEGMRIRVPIALAEQVRARAAATRDALASAGYDVIGDLDDLMPLDTSFDDRGPQRIDIDDDEVEELAAEVLAAAGRPRMRTVGRARALLARVRREASHG
jgi:hypothetical protein